MFIGTISEVGPFLRVSQSLIIFPLPMLDIGNICVRSLTTEWCETSIVQVIKGLQGWFQSASRGPFTPTWRRSRFRPGEKLSQQPRGKHLVCYLLLGNGSRARGPGAQPPRPPVVQRTYLIVALKVGR